MNFSILLFLTFFIGGFGFIPQKTSGTPGTWQLNAYLYPGTWRQTASRIVTWLAKTKWPDRTSFFRVRCTSFHIHSTLLTFFLCFIVLFQSCCSHAQVFGKTLLHEFPILNSHTEWNLLSSGTNTLLWWRACFTKLNYKQNNLYPRLNMCITDESQVQLCKVPEDVENYLMHCHK